jgi:hypothetical protein
MSASTTDRLTFDEIQRDKVAAARMTAVCPYCAGTAKVLAQHHQATRAQPCQFLGFEGFCVTCQLGGIPVEQTADAEWTVDTGSPPPTQLLASVFGMGTGYFS